MARVVLRYGCCKWGIWLPSRRSRSPRTAPYSPVAPRDGTLRLWRAESGDQLVRRIMPAPPTSLAWMRGQCALLCGTGDRQKLVSEPVSFGAAGGRIAAGPVGTGGALLWDFRAGPPHFLERHHGPVASVAITPDGRQVLSASDNASVRVWDITTGRKIRVLKGHRDRVWGLVVSPDGRTVATGSLDTDIRIWNVENGTTTKIIKHRAARNRDTSLSTHCGMSGLSSWSRIVETNARSCVRIPFSPESTTENAP